MARFRDRFHEDGGREAAEGRGDRGQGQESAIVVIDSDLCIMLAGKKIWEETY